MGAVCAQLSVVDARLDQLQHQARGRTRVPENLPHAAEILRLTGLDGQAEGLGFHPAEHPDLPLSASVVRQGMSSSGPGFGASPVPSKTRSMLCRA